MKVRLLFAAFASLLSSFAQAHPGHDLAGLHLHAGSPSASNSLDLRILFASLVLAWGFQFLRGSRRGAGR